MRLAMKVEETPNAVRRTVNRLRQDGKRIGLVPTMGALHEGHLSLVRCAREECDAVYVSIFVNPTQFGPTEDLDTYPRPFDKDCEACRAEGVDYIFSPSVADMYPDGYQTEVRIKELTRLLCGASRPTHFQGVATVCSKLFNICNPHAAYFGQKDFQQCVVIQRMVADLNMDLEIRVCPTVREEDGLAMSSRNWYLSTSERAQATCLYRALCAAKSAYDEGETRTDRLIGIMRRTVEAEEATRIDYMNVVDPRVLKGVARADERSVLVIAVWVGRARLIDNMALTHWP